MDFNGAAGSGAVKAAGPGLAGAKGTVNFFTASPSPYTGSPLVTFTINDLAPGPYSLRLEPFNTLGPTEEIFVDGAGSVLDPQLTFGTALVNYRPLVWLTRPTNGAAFVAPVALQISADASDLDGSIAKVEFYDGRNKLGQVTVGPYNISWPAVPVGVHRLFAVAWDNLGATNISDAVIFSVSASPVTPEPVAIFASERDLPVGSKVVNFNGNRHTVTGKIHSNSDIDVSGNNHLFRNGAVEFVTGINPAPNFQGKVTFQSSTVTQSMVKPYPVDFALADFAPGGAVATAAAALGKYFPIKGDTQLDSFVAGSVLKEGLYYVEGKIHLARNSLRGKVTLVATDEIQFSASGSSFEAYTRCLLAFSVKQTARFDTPAIQASASDSKWQGIIFAPNGGVEITGSGNALLLGSLMGRAVKISGADFQIAGIVPGTCAPLTQVSASISAQHHRIPSSGLLAPVLVPVRVGDSVQFVVATVSGVTYILEYTDSLTNPAWKTWAVFQGDDASKTLDPPTDAPQRFYRLRVD